MQIASLLVMEREVPIDPLGMGYMEHTRDELLDPVVSAQWG